MKKGILHEIEKSQVRELKPVTAESFKKFYDDLSKEPIKPPEVFLSEDTHNYFVALLLDDKKEIARLEKEHRIKAEQRLKETHKRILADYGDGVFETFVELDKRYNRNPFSDYQWTAFSVYLEDNEYDSCEVKVVLDGKFVVSKTYSDETGWFTETTDRVECEYDEVFDVIERLTEEFNKN